MEVIDGLDQVQEKVYKRPTILVSGRVKGEEEIPEGVVAVLTPDMPDVLSHVSVRARNSKVTLLHKISVRCRIVIIHDKYYSCNKSFPDF